MYQCNIYRIFCIGLSIKEAIHLLTRAESAWVGFRFSLPSRQNYACSMPCTPWQIIPTSIHQIKQAKTHKLTK